MYRKAYRHFISKSHVMLQKSLCCKALTHLEESDKSEIS